MEKKMYRFSGFWKMYVYAESEEAALEYFNNESDIDDFCIDTEDIKLEVLD